MLGVIMGRVEFLVGSPSRFDTANAIARIFARHSNKYILVVYIMLIKINDQISPNRRTDDSSAAGSNNANERHSHNLPLFTSCGRGFFLIASIVELHTVLCPRARSRVCRLCLSWLCSLSRSSAQMRARASALRLCR